MFGDKLYDAVGFPTPVDIPLEVGTRAFCIPSSSAWFALVMGCLMLLADEENWQQNSGGITAAEAAEAAQEIIDSGYDGTCDTGGGGNIPTPFWDTATDVDDEFAPEDQIWYGEVDDPDLPPGELTFTENAAIWAFTGFVAFATLEVGAATAIFFHTLAKRWVMAFKRGSIGEVIRVLVDGVEYGRVDTSSASEGEIVEVRVMPPDDDEPHDIMLIQVS